MINPTITDDTLLLEVEGIDKLWSLKGHLKIPLIHITGVRIDKDIAHEQLNGIKMGGARIPNVIKAGTFWENGKTVYWDVHKPEEAVVIELSDEKYTELVIEVADPEKFVDDLKAKLDSTQ